MRRSRTTVTAPHRRHRHPKALREPRCAPARDVTYSRSDVSARFSRQRHGVSFLSLDHTSPRRLRGRGSVRRYRSVPTPSHSESIFLWAIGSSSAAASTVRCRYVSSKCCVLAKHGVRQDSARRIQQSPCSRRAMECVRVCLMHTARHRLTRHKPRSGHLHTNEGRDSREDAAAIDRELSHRVLVDDGHVATLKLQRKVEAETFKEEQHCRNALSTVTAGLQRSFSIPCSLQQQICTLHRPGETPQHAELHARPPATTYDS